MLLSVKSIDLNYSVFSFVVDLLRYSFDSSEMLTDNRTPSTAVVVSRGKQFALTVSHVVNRDQKPIASIVRVNHANNYSKQNQRVAKSASRVVEPLNK